MTRPYVTVTLNVIQDPCIRHGVDVYPWTPNQVWGDGCVEFDGEKQIIVVLNLIQDP